MVQYDLCAQLFLYSILYCTTVQYSILVTYASTLGDLITKQVTTRLLDIQEEGIRNKIHGINDGG